MTVFEQARQEALAAVNDQQRAAAVQLVIFGRRQVMIRTGRTHIPGDEP